MQPLLLSTWSFGQPANAAAWPGLSGGGDALDAAEAVACYAEADPAVTSVGLGGDPDASGEVVVDAQVMLSPARAGAVAGVRRCLHAATLARAVMERTRHRLIVGHGADGLADDLGHPRQDMLTEPARRRYEVWRSDHPDGVDYLPPANLEEQWGEREGGKDGNPADAPLPGHDTIGALALDTHGTLAGSCTTSGMAYKHPGRVGDSPVLGHGLYVLPGVGAAVLTGTGELAMGVCAAFLAVETMRGGAGPGDAARVVIDRVVETYDLHPDHQLGCITLAAGGGWSAASLRPGYRTAVRSAERDEMVTPEYVALA